MRKFGSELEIPYKVNVYHSSGSIANSYTIQMVTLIELTKQHVLNVKKISDVHTYKLNSSPEKLEHRYVSTYRESRYKCNL